MQDQVVLLRVQMPEMDGLTATSILHERERGGDTHVAVHRSDRPRYERRPESLPACRNGRLSHQLDARNSSRHPAPVPESIPGIACFKPTESSVNAAASQRSFYA